MGAVHSVKAVLDGSWTQQATWDGMPEGTVVMAPFTNMPDDVKAMAPKVMRHRLRTTYEADARSIKCDELIARVLEAVPTP